MGCGSGLRGTAVPGGTTVVEGAALAGGTLAGGATVNADAGKGALVTVDCGSIFARMASRVRIRGDSG